MTGERDAQEDSASLHRQTNEWFQSSASRSVNLPLPQKLFALHSPF